MKLHVGKLSSRLISSGHWCEPTRLHQSAKTIIAFIFVSGLAATNIDAQKLWQPDYSDANGWINSVYGTTIMLGDINGDGRADVCGRGIAGIYCALSTGSSFGPVIFSTSSFSDAAGWAGSSSYYGSIRLGDVNGDGFADICGRGAAGIYCALSNGNGTFAPLQLWQPDYSDANGWINPVYGTTIMLGDINGDGFVDVCGRGIAGIYCALSTGSSFGPVIFSTSSFSDAAGWAGSNTYYGSIRLGDVNGDGRADICGRGGAGIYCALYNTGGTFASLQLWQPDYSDTNGWINSVYGTTITLGDINGDGRADVCGRGAAGIYCALSKGSSFGPVNLTTDNFSDAAGWAGSNTYYGSIRLGDVNGDGLADVCGRGAAGIYCGVAGVVFANGASTRPGLLFEPEPRRNAEELDAAVEDRGRPLRSEAGSGILRSLSALNGRRRDQNDPLLPSWRPYGSDSLARRTGPRTRA